MRSVVGVSKTRRIVSSMALGLLLAGAFAVAPSAVPLAVADPGDAAELYLAPSTPGGTIGSVNNASLLRECPSNKVLVGVETENRQNVPVNSANSILVRFNLVCATVTVSNAGAVQTSNFSMVNNTIYDQGRGNITTAQCPAGQAVHRITGTTFVGDNGNRWPSQVTIVCRPMIVTAAGELRVNLAEPATTLTSGTNFNTNGGLETPALQCGPAATTGTSNVFVRGYRPQNGGEGMDGFVPSCAVIPRDFGDAPTSYGSASHELNAATYMGWSADAETDMQSNSTATGDNQESGTAPNQFIDDENGVASFSPIVATETNTYSVSVLVSNKASAVAANLVGWIDFDRSGVFDPDEGVSVPVPAGTSDGTTLALNWSGIAAQAVPGPTFARFRIAVGNALTAATPTGNGAQGEIEDYALTIAAATPALALTKTVAPEAITEADQVVTYSFEIINTGNVTVSDVKVADSEFSGTGPIDMIVCPSDPVVLAPGEGIVCEASYSATQADVDAGVVTNTASAIASSPAGDTVTSEPSSARFTVAPAPAISVVKSVSPSDQASFVVGQEVTYSFVVTNTGNVTLTDVEVDDAEFTGAGSLSPVVCPTGATRLAPNTQITCTASYTLVQEDIDAGTVRNSATASGNPPSGANPPVSPLSTAEMPALAQPGVSVTKTASLDRVTAVGQVITYSFLVTNTGDVTLNNPEVVEGEFNGHGTLSPVICPSAAASLLPGAQVACVATYAVVAADLVSGQRLRNTATVIADDPGGVTVPSAPSSASVDMSPGLSVNTGGVVDSDLGPSYDRGLLWGALMGFGVIILMRGMRRTRPVSSS